MSDFIGVSSRGDPPHRFCTDDLATGRNSFGILLREASSIEGMV
jgi:hypothetical protein